MINAIKSRQTQLGWALLLVAGCWLAASLAAVAQVAQVAAGDPAELEQAENYLNNFMTNLASDVAGRSAPPPPPRASDLSGRLDQMAQALSGAVANDPQLAVSLNRALHFEELATQEPGQARPKRSLLFLLGGPRGVAPLGAPAASPHIVHSPRRAADPEKIRAQAQNHFVRLSSFAQRDWLEAAQELETGGAQAPRRSLEPLTRVVLAIANYGFHLLDFVYTSPQFIERLPLVGQEIRQLKEKGESIYHVTKLVRHTSSLYKLMQAEPAAATRLKGVQRRELPAEGQVQVQVNGSPEGGALAEGQGGLESELSVRNEAEVTRQRKIEECKRLIGNAGLQAIKSIVRMALQKRLNETAEEEANTRTFYMLMANAIL